MALSPGPPLCGTAPWCPFCGCLASVLADPQGPRPPSSISKASLPLEAVPPLRGIQVPAVKIMDFSTQLCDAKASIEAPV